MKELILSLQKVPNITNRETSIIRVALTSLLPGYYKRIIVQSPDKFVLLKILFSIVKKGSRTIPPEEEYHPTVELTLVLNQTLNLTGGAIFLGDNYPDTVKKASVLQTIHYNLISFLYNTWLSKRSF